MKVLIAPDKFKGTLTAQQVCDCIENGLKVAYPDAVIQKFPLADGGDGTLDVLMQHQKSSFIEVEVSDPSFKKIRAGYGLSANGKTAFIEMARASGLVLVNERSRNILNASTFGTGELIRDALDRGVKKIILGIGGSATNDAALGAAQALGYKFLDGAKNVVTPVGKNLIDVKYIDRSNVHTKLKSVIIKAICDVNNPFYGPDGAANIFGPQKGASAEDITTLDKGMQNIAVVFKEVFNIEIQAVTGSGAGGGFAGGAHVLFQAELKSGYDVVFESTDFEAEVKKADVIITGEGKIDKQTLQGKLLHGIAGLAKKHKKPLIAVVGQSELSEEETLTLGFERVYSLTEFGKSKERAMNEAQTLLLSLAESISLRT